MQQSNKRSHLILIGGAEDKKGDKIVLKKVIEVSKAKTVVLIPTASSYPREVYSHYEEAFKKLGVENLYCLDIRYKDEVDKEEYFNLLEKAELCFFSGGDQVKLVETFEGTKLLEQIKKRFFEGTLCVAGTSAGAASASDPMLFDGDYRGFIKGSVNMGKGFGFIDNITIDTHFLHRERVPRLSQFLMKGITTKGIGLDEDTGIVISPDLKFEVVGSGMVTVMNSERVTYSDFNEVAENDVFTYNNLNIGFLAPGTYFSMKRWAVLKTNKKNNVTELIKEAFLN